MKDLEKTSEIVRKAKAYSREKHEGQIRKFENKPYFIHPKRVAHILYQFKESKNIDLLVAVCYLHDVVEDTTTTIQDIKKEFGSFIANLVKELTSDASRIEEVGKEEYLARKMIAMSSYALSIKLADRLDNVNRLQWQPKSFSDKYIKQTRYIVDRLLRERKKLSMPQKLMLREIDRHLGDEAEEDIDYLSFDSYMKRAGDKK